MVDLIENSTISGKIAKTVFLDMWETGKEALTIVEEKDLKQISDPQKISAVIDEILTANPRQIEQYKAGKQQLFGFFVGNVLKRFQGKANPDIVNKILKDKLA